ncbi:MAG: Holliday junction branch migration protein RuvA [Clostridiales bacterium]|nr:Holliday junction branch migration protein RuvA [Clostridiales bacterium]
MFAYICGTLAEIGENHAVIDVGGIGFRLKASYNTLRCLPDCGEQVRLYTYLNVREDAMELYGFYSESERDAFEMLTSVSGVGPRVAMAVLSELTPEQFALAIATKNTRQLMQASGVGQKLAQRIVLELTDRIGSDLLVTCDNNENVNSHAVLRFGDGADEAVAALVVLGYTQSDAIRVIRRMNTEGLTVEDMIREALKQLSC